jgi:hypothetical protein
MRLFTELLKDNPHFAKLKRELLTFSLYKKTVSLKSYKLKKVKAQKQCCGSWIFIPDPNFSILDPGSEFFIPDPGPGSTSKNLSILTQKNCF